MTRRMAALRSASVEAPPHVVGADLVHEAGAVAGGSGFLDEDFAGTEGYSLDRAVLEVDDTR